MRWQLWDKNDWRSLCWKHVRDFGMERLGGKKLKTETE